MIMVEQTLDEILNTSFTLHEIMNMGKITFLDQKPTVKPTALTSEDLIALSVAWYRLRKNSQAAFLGIDNLTSTILAKEVTQDDRVVADQIRKYYSQKLMMIKLTKNSISKFREDLNVFIHSTSPTTDDKMLPLAYRLPEFYDYDTAFDLFKQEFNTKVTDHVYSYRTTQLTFLKSFTVGKSTNKRKEFWFSDTYKNLVNFNLLNNNPLISLLEKQFHSPINLNGKYLVRTRDNLEYVVVDKYTF
jgi:hypothetical protein